MSVSWLAELTTAFWRRADCVVCILYEAREINHINKAAFVLWLRENCLYRNSSDIGPVHFSEKCFFFFMMNTKLAKFAHSVACY